MSAFIVEDHLIDGLVSYFTGIGYDDGLWIELNGEYKYLKTDNAPVIAEILYSENVRSVNNRYTDQEGDEGYKFTYNPRAKTAYTIEEIASAIDCLEYQSCECDDYRTTKAYDIITRMRKELLSKLQAQSVNEAAWGLRKITDRVEV